MTSWWHQTITYLWVVTEIFGYIALWKVGFGDIPSRSGNSSVYHYETQHNRLECHRMDLGAFISLLTLPSSLFFHWAADGMERRRHFLPLQNGSSGIGCCCPWRAGLHGEHPHSPCSAPPRCHPFSRCHYSSRLQLHLCGLPMQWPSPWTTDGVSFSVLNTCALRTSLWCCAPWPVAPALLSHHSELGLAMVGERVAQSTLGGQACGVGGHAKRASVGE
jgi:hypothetical protein